VDQTASLVTMTEWYWHTYWLCGCHWLNCCCFIERENYYCVRWTHMVML